MKRIFSILLSFLLLMVGGQAMAAGNCTSATGAAWATASTWADGTAGGAACDGTTAIPAAGDNAIIDHAVTVGAAASITNLTVNATKSLTLSAALTVSGTATINGGITYTTGTWPTPITSIGELFTATLSAAYTLPVTVTSLGSGVSVSGGALTLAAANVVTGNVTITAGGSIVGVLKLAPTGNHTITAIATAGSIIPSLDLSGATANKVITSATGDLTLTAVTFPTAASKQITFTAAAAKTISVPVPAATVAVCYNNSSTTAATAGATTVAAGTSMVCTTPAGTTGGTVSAPIFSTKEKPTVFSEEVKH